MFYLVKIFALFGGMGILAWQVFCSVFRKPFLTRDILQQMVLLAFNSLAMVFLIAASVGMVVGLQLGINLEARFPHGSDFLGGSLGVAFCTELGPVLMCIMLTGRVGASITAEIASMKLTEQLDALRSLSIDPVHYLLVPRVLATVFLFPFLGALADFFGLLGGYLSAWGNFDQSFDVFLRDFQNMVRLVHVFGGLWKTSVFAFLMVVVSAYYGFQSSGGSSGIGRSVQKSVVTANILIVVLDFFLNTLILWFFP